MVGKATTRLVTAVLSSLLQRTTRHYATIAARLTPTRHDWLLAIRPQLRQQTTIAFYLQYHVARSALDRRLGESGDGELNDQHGYKVCPLASYQISNQQWQFSIFGFPGDVMDRNATSHLTPTTHNSLSIEIETTVDPSSTKSVLLLFLLLP
jgi:hypothetical protein